MGSKACCEDKAEADFGMSGKKEWAFLIGLGDTLDGEVGGEFIDSDVSDFLSKSSSLLVTLWRSILVEPSRSAKCFDRGISEPSSDDSTLNVEEDKDDVEEEDPSDSSDSSDSSPESESEHFSSSIALAAASRYLILLIE